MSKLFIQIQFLNAQKVYSYVHKDSSFHGVVYMESLTYSHFGKKYHTQKKKGQTGTKLKVILLVSSKPYNPLHSLKSEPIAKPGSIIYKQNTSIIVS